MIDLEADETRPIRAGEELDLARLEVFLRARWPDLAGPLEVMQFPHGHSNLTYLVRAGARELVLRRPPLANPVKSAHDMGREYRVLARLCEVYEPAPRPFAFCADERVLGAPFYVMERRRGLILRGRTPPAGLSLGPDAARRLGRALVDQLARLHGLDYRAADLADLGKPQGYVERQVDGWTRRLLAAQTGPMPELEQAARWLAGNRPDDSGAALIHNDFKLDNLVLDPGDLGRVVAVLDWEMATIGDPWLDLGTTLAYWVEADDPEDLQQLVVGPTTMPGSPTRRALADRYQEQTGRAAPHLLFDYVYGLFKVAVIAQQLYARYVRGATRDERFARLDRVIAALGSAAARAVARGRV